MPDPDARRLLVDMLHEAAKLEHCLLNTYLAAACSVKSTPQEFAMLGGTENRRRAVQFERVRAWKLAIMNVAHEEMRHLHFVQCMLRALGEPACFDLPDKTAAGVWNIPNWRIRTGQPVGRDGGVDVPVGPIDRDAVQRFILYESSDSLQDENPLGSSASALFERLHAFEIDLRFTNMLQAMPAGPDKTALLAKLRQVYLELPPSERLTEASAELRAMWALPGIESVRFQSIGDFYQRGILPLYEQAFDSGWVVNNDRNLVDEQLNPDYAAEGFLPIGPIGRTAKFARLVAGNQANPLNDYKKVADIVKEIVEEGEGAAQFRHRAERMLAKIADIGVEGFLAALDADKSGGRDPSYMTPAWLAEAQLLRESHLYTFAMIAVEYKTEQKLADSSGLRFEAARAPVPATAPGLRSLTESLPKHFNACYVAMLAWLSRMYEPRQWASDTPRRMAIEMIATWPLMSLAIRPFLELASFFPIDWKQLFRIEPDGLPMLPVWGQELLVLWRSPERSEALNVRMDYLVVRTLRAAADWAHDQVWAVDAANLPAHESTMIRTRLHALTRLTEFERQFPYRVAGGYSDRTPNITYQNTHKENNRYEENPNFNTVFADSLVLRLRFGGWGLVQLATDPDPPSDEVGCSGTLMLHAADGDRRFDRALVWQNFEPGLNILRPVADGGPRLGVNVLDASLMAPAPNGGAAAGYLPLQIMSSTGAVQTSGLQQNLGLNGLFPIASVDAAAMTGGGERQLRMFLESRNRIRPFLYGENHLVWQDGEPIDPFILSVYADAADPGSPPKLLFRREVFNEGLALSAMDPLQRLNSSRGPCGFDSAQNIPSWASTESLAQAISAPGFPMSFLQARRDSLIRQLKDAGDKSDSDQTGVDLLVSIAERLMLVAAPAGTTVGWLTVLLHYGHTLSGAMEVGATANPILDALSTRTGFALDIAPAGSDRGAPNARWLTGYTKGVMDTDAISDFVYGELYVPLAVTATGPVSFSRDWHFAAGLADSLAGFGTRFAAPFWGTFTVSGETRTEAIGGLDPRDRSRVVMLTDRLVSQDARSYRFVTEGIPGLDGFSGCFAVTTVDGEAILTCRFDANARDAAALVNCISWLAATADAMRIALAAHFGPR